MKLWDLMDMDLYRQMLSEKYIRLNDFTLDEDNWFRKRTLTIINYTEKAQFDNVWNEVTRQCRGLVIDKYFNVLARPFDKFLNYTEADNVWLDEPAIVTDKMDGSLGIIFCDNKTAYGDHWKTSRPSGVTNAVHYEPWRPSWSVITRGSYDSEQAQFARKWLQDKLKYYDLDPAWTYLVEIIYPENRIVVNYGDRKELVWLGARNIESGLVRRSPSQWEWLGSETEVFPYSSLRTALECPPRTNAEGYVVYFPRIDYRIKLKQDDYVALHKIVTGLTERRVWENMKDGKTLSDLCEIVPDEWHVWLEETYEKIISDFNELSAKVRDDYEDLMYGLLGIYGASWTRKQLAEEALKYDYPSLMFSLQDRKDIEQKLWDLVKPTAE